MSASSSAPPMGKYFASTEKKVRDKATKQLATFLSESENALPPPEMVKLWKGIFYCFWMSDKPLVQQGLASELAEIILSISSPSISLAFLDGFWQTHVREWSGIDRLRIDKYYMLVRRFVNAGFRLLIRHNWDEALCAEYNEILLRNGGPLFNSPKIPTSLTFHVADIYLEELDKAIGASESESSAPLCTLTTPFLFLAARTPKSTTYDRIQNSVLYPVLSEVSSSDSPPSPKRARLDESVSSEYVHVFTNPCANGQEQVDVDVLKSKLLRQIFESASDSDTQSSNRKKLYALWKEFGDDVDDD